ncbi:MAG TPA: amidohydrolase family protein [Terriglobales bacterium]|jgi:predicted TIM-barrel fold metal-dependent hydrolase|nr:amidohydrolase family protein [Terriglobales bacterium]
MDMNEIGRFVSADGHANEPGDLWIKRMDKRFRDRAPRIERREDADYFVADGLPAFAMEGLLGGMADSKKAGRELTMATGNRSTDIRAGATDPVARLADQDLDNLRAEVCYPNHALFLMAAPDVEYRRECFRAYNDWLVEYCSVNPRRLLGVGILPTGGPIGWAVAEAERLAKNGIRSVLMPSGRTRIALGDPYFRPLWSALQELAMPIAFHVVASDNIEENLPNVTPEMGGHLFASTGTKLAASMYTVAALIGSGVAQNYPNTRFVVVEGGFGWVAAQMCWFDHWWRDHRKWMLPRLEQAPSFYLKRQFYFTFEDDRAGLLTRHLLNIDHVMWGSDYPHTEGTFPASREHVARDFADIPAQEVRKMVADNAARLYGI